MVLDEPKEEQVHLINGVRIMVEDRILNYLGDVQIDYISNEYGEGFAIIPENSGGSCC
ncbi:MAG: Fe-S cluster assembly protein HesB [Calditerrivibrio nitroreducens]|uniref:Fe-S cluster assembly protein HesB n=1 Tax=Calditerrivibrio nitroreducens TaxID=477976 RepID=A0A2J6WNG0_9BACT|nr:MAG: Fe-S cluster assembly protein HesB [Calditerrivibrio nitroreducens]